MSAFIKNIFREISHTKSRFFSIFAIIAIGAGFFAGLKATCPDMIATLVDYFKDNDLMDIRLVSSYGFDEKDIEAIRDTEGIREIWPTYSKDVFVSNEENTSVIARVMSIPDETTVDYAAKDMNKPVLIDGRMPEKPNECLVDAYSLMLVTFDIGDSISVYTTDTENPLSDSLKRNEWTVVGKIMTPQYISYERGNTDIGTGTLDMYIMVPEGNFKYDVFTDVYLTMESTAGLDAFSDEYEAAIEAEKDKFEALSEIREPARLSEIKSEAEEKIADAKEKIADAKEELADAEEELADAYKELTDGEKELADGKKEYEDGLKEFEEETADAEKKIKSGSNKIKKGWEELHKNEEDLILAEEQFNSQLEAMGMTPEGLYSAKEQLDGAISMLEQYPGYEQMPQYQELVNQRAQIAAAISGYEQLVDAREQLENGRAALSAGAEELTDARKTLAEEKIKAQKELDDAKKEIEDAEKELADGWKEYYDGLEEFEDGKAEAEEKIADAEIEIADGEEELADLKMPVWYVFTRDDNPGYSTYEADANRIESVTKVFPIFFFMVAMLVCLTTMTRMVEEERTETGTMKALGYGKGAIAAKYLIYSSFASVSGSIVGIVIGTLIFPNVIYSAYEMMYTTPPLKSVPQPVIWVLIVLACIICTTAAVLMAAMAELRSNPAVLMRPKAPKAGKRVLLERVDAIWSRLNFTQKVTVRNLFRYKKRIFMTILGIAGCTALMLTGFGVFTSVTVILDKQYNDLFHYDLVVSLDTDAKEEVLLGTDKLIENDPVINESLPIYMMSAKYEGIGDLSLAVAESGNVFFDMITLRELKSQKPVELNDEGVVITQRFSELSGLRAGDEFTFICDDKEITASITGVAENYTLHFIYMTNTLYEELTGEAPQRNAYFCMMTDDSKETQDKLANELMSDDGVIALTFSRNSMDTFEDTVENLKYVVILIIVSAALLAVVVLYNLTNINITERIREIATIKVLGFYNREVSDYIFRENILLSLMGDLIGLVVGIWFHKFVINVAQTDSVMFGRTLPAMDFVYAFVMTLVFTYLVNFIMYFKLKKVSMVESLKSIE